MADTKVGLRAADCIKTRYSASFIDKVQSNEHFNRVPA